MAGGATGTVLERVATAPKIESTLPSPPRPPVADRARSSHPSFPLVLLALLLAFGGMVLLGGRARAGAHETGAGRGPAQGPETLADGRVPGGEGTLDPAVCSQAGYPCPGLAERDEPRVLRWNDDTPVIRIGLPMPAGVDPKLARELQAAAAAGILTWQDKPFRIELERGPASSDPDFRVRWTPRLEGAQLGRADTRWFRRPDGRTGMEVSDFVLVHRDPFDPERPLTARKVQLAAAHEMGHALGLPHSDSDRDVMFPTNTARSLSARDYTTMAALYSLENGALLPPGLNPP